MQKKLRIRFLLVLTPLISAVFYLAMVNNTEPASHPESPKECCQKKDGACGTNTTEKSDRPELSGSQFFSGV